MPAIAEMIAGMAHSYGQNNIDASSLMAETMIKLSKPALRFLWPLGFCPSRCVPDGLFFVEEGGNCLSG
jgi:hypothetical protein